jgi:hypothetical protein
MPVPFSPATGEMHDFELDDDFWSGALAALREEAPLVGLRERWPAFAELIEGLVADAEREPILAGFRLATHGRNPRLFAVLTGALLARSAIPTLVLDLSPDTRWLEQLLGGDYKEGFVDHLRFGVPLAQCVRESGLERLSAMSGGAWFLAGSPLDDAPGFRAGLEELRRLHRAVIVTVPPPLEAGDRTGIAALCGALVTVEEQGTEAVLAGSERAVVRLKGHTDAARDLAHLTHRFLGPLPALLGGTRPRLDDRRTAPGVVVADTPGAEDVVFLRGFERSHPDREKRSPARPFRRSRGERKPGGTFPSMRRKRFTSRRAMIAAVLVLGVVAIAGVGARGIAVDVVRDMVGGSDRPYAEPGGQTIALDPVPDRSTPESTAPAGSALEDQQTMLGGGLGRPAPFSVHVGSYQNTSSAMRVAEGVAAMGYAATLAPVSIPGKGRWYRVYAGSFADSTEAVKARDHLQSSDIVDEGVVRSVPWTFEIGTYPSTEAAKTDAAEMRDKGVAAFAVGQGPVRLYAGAYQSPEEAELLADALEALADNRTVRLIRREE